MVMIRSRISSLFSNGFQAVLAMMPWSSRAEQGRIERAFQDIESEQDRILLSMMYHALARLMRRRRKAFGMLIVCGWKREWLQEFASFPDSSQNLFSEREYVIPDYSADALEDVLAKTADFDGAILVSRRGSIIASGVYLEGMDPKGVAEQMGAKGGDDLSEAFGFSRKVHTRHLAGIACSFRLPGTTVFVVSEEHRDVRIFRTGTIAYSTYAKEIPKGKP